MSFDPTQTPQNPSSSFQFSWYSSPVTPAYNSTSSPTPSTPQAHFPPTHYQSPTSQAHLSKLLNVTNSQTQHLHLSHDKMCQMIQQFETELQQLVLDQKIYEDQKIQLQLQNHQISSQIENDAQHYHISSSTIISHPEYFQKQQQTLKQNQELLAAKESQANFRIEYIKDLYRQLQELQAQQQLELQRIQEAQQEQQRHQEQQYQQHLNQQLEQTQQQQTLQLQQQHLQHQDRLKETTPSLPPPTASQTMTPKQPISSIPQSNQPAHGRLLPSQALQEQKQAFGLDIKLMHFYTFQYILYNVFSLHFKASQTQTQDQKYILTIFGIWAYQTNHTSDFPILIFNRIPQLIDEWNNLPNTATKPEKPDWLKNALATTLPLSDTNNNYTALYSIVDFLVQFNPKHQHAHFINPYLSATTLSLISTIQSTYDINAIKSSLDETLSLNVNKISKLYNSIFLAIARFGGLVACQFKSQFPSNLSKFHPSYILFSIIKFYHEFVNATSDHYLVGIVFAFLSSISPFFHYTYLGNLLHSHKHTRSSPPTPINNDLSPTPVYHLTQSLTCTLPCCSLMSRSPHEINIEKTSSRIRLISAYAQSFISKSDPQLAINNENVFSLQLGTLRRKVDHPVTNMDELGNFMTQLHTDFTTFTQKFSENIVAIKLLPSSSSIHQYIPLVINSTWERCSFCGYNGITAAHHQHPQSTTIPTDPHWQYSDIINQSVTSTIIKPLLEKISMHTIPKDNLLYNNCHPYPVIYPFSSFNQYHPTSLATELQSPSLLNQRIPIPLIGNKLRISFLWSYFVQIINSAITPTYIHCLLRFLQIGAAQLRFTYGQTGHQILEFVFNEIISKQKDQLIGQNEEARLTHATIVDDFSRYHRGDVQKGIQPNTLYPFDADEKKIAFTQTVDVVYEYLDKNE